MPPRQRDIVQRHDNVVRRVTALETGAHPTGSYTEYFDSIPRTDITILAASDWHAGAGTPRWQRRIGIVSLEGEIDPDGGDAGSAAAEDVIASLPDEARPAISQMITVAASTPPYVARVKVDKNGDVTLYRGTLDGDTIVYLDGINYPAV